MEVKDFEKDAKPREIFVYICQRIAEPLINIGFKYKKSKNEISKKEIGFTYIIYLQPSIRFGSTTFSVHIIVKSEDLAKWRKDKLINENDGFILSTYLARLTKRENDSPSYEVSTFLERERSISEINSQIDEYGIPFFKRFQNLRQLIEDIQTQGLLPHRKNQFAMFDKDAINHFIRCFDS